MQSPGPASARLHRRLQAPSPSARNESHLRPHRREYEIHDLIFSEEHRHLCGAMGVSMKIDIQTEFC